MNMIINIFSIFDPSNYYITTAWLILIIPILMAQRMNLKISKTRELMKTIINIMIKELIEINKKREIKGTSKTIRNIFIMVIIINIIAIIPLNFTPTAHISICVAIRMTIWTSRIINAIINSTKNTLLHLTPIGTPIPLINFIVLIEIVRNIIRPITLAVRLTANIVAGHLLLSLLSNFSIISIINATTRLVPMLTLVSLEIAVAIIQAYVITTLVCLYYKERF